MTPNKIISLLLGLIVVVLASGIVFVQQMNNHSYSASTNIQNSPNLDTTPNNVVATSTLKTTKTPTPTPVVVPAAKTPGQYTLADVAKHASGSSCWSVVNGGVYDLTSWISQHPGGSSAILSMCGHDGSAAFDDQHGGQRRPANELSGFKIGTLVAN